MCAKLVQPSMAALGRIFRLSDGFMEYAFSYEVPKYFQMALCSPSVDQGELAHNGRKTRAHHYRRALQLPS